MEELEELSVRFFIFANSNRHVLANVSLWLTWVVNGRRKWNEHVKKGTKADCTIYDSKIYPVSDASFSAVSNTPTNAYTDTSINANFNTSTNAVTYSSFDTISNISFVIVGKY